MVFCITFFKVYSLDILRHSGVRFPNSLVSSIEISYLKIYNLLAESSGLGPFLIFHIYILIYRVLHRTFYSVYI